MHLEGVDHYLLVGSVVVMLAALAVRLSVRIGLPSLLLYMAIGVLLGDAVLGFQFDDADLAEQLGYLGLMIILIEGGLTTKWRNARPTALVGLSLATVGSVVSAGVVGVIVHYLFGLDWQTSLLIGAVTAPTDAAAVFAVLRKVPLRPKLLGALEGESGLNDAATVLLVTLLSTGHGDDPPMVIVATIVYELAGGIAFGAAVGFVGAWVMRRVALPASGLYPISVFTIAIVGYAGAGVLHMSGFAAAYVGGLVLGNSNLPHHRATMSFSEGLAWLAQIGLFVMLGLLVSPERITTTEVVRGVIIGLVLTLIGRPVSVFVATIGFRFEWREKLFVGLAGLRGAVPIVLATIPLAHEVRAAHHVFDVVFVLVVVMTLLTAPSLSALASRLHLTVDAPRDLEMDAAPLEKIEADLVVVHVTAESKLHGVATDELYLPPGVSVSLVVRGDAAFSPHGSTTLQRGDDVLFVTPRGRREQTEKRLQQLSRHGRLAGWLD